jgi:hypothetical protein
VETKARWGFLGTSVWTLAIAIVFVLTQTIAALIYLGAVKGDPTQLKNMEALAEDGDVLSVSTWATFFVCGLLVFVAVLSKSGADIRDYLGFHNVSWRVYVVGIVAMIALMMIIELGNLVFNRPVPETMFNAYRTADNKMWFCLAIVLAAPVFEELFFRGFLHSGLERTVLGVAGAIVISAGFWALVHIQYQVYEVVMIFLMGTVLGLARWLTGSIYIPIVMHGLNNLVSTVQISYLSSQEIIVSANLFEAFR